MKSVACTGSSIVFRNRIGIKLTLGRSLLKCLGIDNPGSYLQSRTDYNTSHRKAEENMELSESITCFVSDVN